jgi:hypothetical protein
MSKKSRKRNKKILGALAAGLGAMALAKRGRGEISSNRPSGIDAAMNVASKVSNVAAKPSKWISPRMFGHGPQAGDVGQDIRAGLSKRVRGIKPPSQLLSPNRVHSIRGMKKGGSVTGAAKRGFGRALMGGKK